MRRRVLLTLLSAAALSAFGKKSDFLKQIPKNDRITHALNRLTFGPRPGDADAVRALGLKKWISQQLDPNSVPENPALLEKLKYMDTLTMSSQEMVQSYPTPQMVRQMVTGQLPLPTDPERRRMIQKLINRAEKKQGDQANPIPAAPRSEEHTS